MARALQIEKDLYKTYEGRTPMPLYLLEPFALVARQDPLYLIFGKQPDRHIQVTRFPINDAV